jgi:hypothetical protein
MLVGQELMHLAQTGRHVHDTNVASTARPNKKVLMKSIRNCRVRGGVSDG